MSIREGGYRRFYHPIFEFRVKRLPPKTRVIGRAGVGIDNIDLEVCRNANISVVTAAGASAVAVAEHALGLMLAVARRIKPAAKSIEDGK